MPCQRQGQVLWDGAAHRRCLSRDRLDSGHHGTLTPIRSSQPVAALKLMVWKQSDQNACQPCARPSCAKRLRRCRPWRSNPPSSQCRHRPMVRRLGVVLRVTSRTDSLTLNRSKTACWLFHQYWRLGDKHAGNREQVRRQFGQKKRRMSNTPSNNASPSPRGALRS